MRRSRRRRVKRQKADSSRGGGSSISPKDIAGVPIHSSARKIAGKLKRKGIFVSKKTVRRGLVAMKYTYSPRPITMALSTRQKERRVDFASTWSGDSKIIIFSNEKIFDTNDKRQKMWVAPGEKAVPRQRMRWAPKCHVCGAIGVGWRYLVVLPSNSAITSETYVETLRKVPFPRKFIFQQDGAGAHKAKNTKN